MKWVTCRYEKAIFRFPADPVGVVYAIDTVKLEIVWAHKIDNSMVNTVRVLDKQHLVVSTMDGKIVLLEISVN